MRTRLRRAVLAGAFGVMAAPSPPAAADELTVTLGAESAAWVRPTATVNLRLSRPLAPDEGSLAVFVGETDWSALARLSGDLVELRPTPLRLPRGESEVTVYLVSPAGAWREVGRVSIRVLTDGGFERAEALPTLELGVQPQPAQGRVPELPPTPRDTFYDGTVRLGLKTTHVRNGWTTTSQANAVGVTYRNEAVRFAQEGTEAPRLDLSDYQLGVQNGSFGLSLGNGVWGTHRHLLSAFRSRGLGGSAKLGGVADLSLALVNGSDVVGFSNLAGVGNSSHRLVAATLGLELVPARPCALRVAGSESK